MASPDIDRPARSGTPPGARCRGITHLSRESALRVAYLGTSDFAATVLRRLADSSHRPALVVTPPDRPRGRGRRLAPPPAAAIAAELGLELVQTADVNAPDVVERLRAAAELVAVCAFGQLIREPLLSELPMLNVHPSLLPRWRGAAPIERAIMAGDPESGVTIMRVTEGLDSGPIALARSVGIEPGEDYGSLAARLAAIGGELLVEALDLQAAGALEFFDQDESAATYAEKIAPAERRLDPALPAAELAAVVRGLTPHVGAYVELDGGERLGVRRASAEGGELAQGTLSTEGPLLLGCREGVLRLETVQPAGGKSMPAEAYLRGHRPPHRVA